MCKEKDNAPQLSEYANTLNRQVKKRYMQTNRALESILFEFHAKITMPNVFLQPSRLTSFHILFLKPATTQRKKNKAFKSLQACNQLVSGFVKSVHGLIIADKHVVLAKVRHSQKMNDPTFPLWIITEDDEKVLCAYCRGCMAGQGETCSNIASVLFYIETFNRIRGKLAFTDKQCEWLLPTYSKGIPFAAAQDIDLRYANKLKQKLDETVEKLC